MNKHEEIDSPAKAVGAVVDDSITNKTPSSSNKNTKRKREASSLSLASRSSKKKPSTAENSLQVITIVHSLPRNALELLIAESLSTATPIKMESLLTLLPESKRWKANPSNLSPAQVKGSSRVGTGLFDSIDDEVMRQILLFLPLRQRIVCVSRVCKPWRNLAALEGLFADLSGTLSQKPCHDSSDYRARMEELTSVKAENTLSLLRWHPKPKSIDALLIETSKVCNPHTCKNIIKFVSEHKKKPKKRSETVPAPLKKLVLQGPKITRATLKTLQSSPIISSRKLTELCLDDVNASKLWDGDILEIMKLCPKLEVLCMTQDLFRVKSLESHIACLSSARNYEPTVLRVLDLSQSSWCSGVGLSTLEGLANNCPELEVLKLFEIAGLPSAAFPPKDSEEDDPVPIPTGFCARPMKALPRLKTFHVSKIVYLESYTTTECVEIFLRWILQGTPVLEDLSFSVGQTKYLSARESKVIRPPKASTSVGNSLSALPLTLKRISLIDAVFQLSDLQSLSLEAIRSLETLQLQGCDPGILDELHDLQQQQQQSKLVLSVKYPTYPYSRWTSGIVARLSKYQEKGFTKYEPSEDHDVEKASVATGTSAAGQKMTTVTGTLAAGQKTMSEYPSVMI